MPVSKFGPKVANPRPISLVVPQVGTCIHCKKPWVKGHDDRVCEKQMRKKKAKNKRKSNKIKMHFDKEKH